MRSFSLLRPARLAGPLLLLAAVSCRSTGPAPAGEPLPFHVAVMPSEVVGGEEDPGGGMRLEVTSGQLTDALAGELASRGFARITILRTDEAEQARLDELGSAEREAHWQQRAREAGADLLMRTTLSYEPEIDGEINDRFWLNLPLFLLGGPMCWFVNDRSYEVAARLQADFFDTTEVHSNLGQWALLPLPIYVELDEAALDFIDRADSGTDYVLGCLIPAGLLARDGDNVVQQVQESFLDQLGDQLVAKVHAERARFDQNSELWAFRMESGGAHAVRNADGTVSFALPVHEVDARTPPYRYEVRAGEALVEGEFAEPGPDGRRWIRGGTPVEAGARWVTVRVEDQNNRARSYTLPIRDAARR